MRGRDLGSCYSGYLLIHKVVALADTSSRTALTCGWSFACSVEGVVDTDLASHKVKATLGAKKCCIRQLRVTVSSQMYFVVSSDIILAAHSSISRGSPIIELLKRHVVSRGKAWASPVSCAEFFGLIYCSLFYTTL